MPARHSLDNMIAHDGEVLEEIMDLLGRQACLSTWPAEATAALAQALRCDALDSRERAKADRLRRHLFIDIEPPELVAPDVAGRIADRVRADLADLVPFGAGFYLVT